MAHQTYVGGAGQNHPQARLTLRQVLAIRRLHGIYPARKLGHRFGVPQRQVHYILKGQRWSRSYTERPTDRPARACGSGTNDCGSQAV